jgi:predicted amidohydrolase
MRLAVVQFQPEFQSREPNWKRIQSIAQSTPVDLVVFPELASCGYMYKSPEEINDFTDSLEALRSIEQISHETGRTIVGGFAERGSDGLYNSAYVVTPEKIEIFRKIHLWNYETQIFQRGDRALLFDFRGHRIGIEICYDLQFPELASFYSRKGAELIVIPMAWAQEPITPADGVQPFNHLAIATAFSHGIFVAVANRVGREREANFPGQSSITDPWGRQRRLETGEGLLEQELDFTLVPEAKHPSRFNELDGDSRLSIELPVSVKPTIPSP